MDEPDPVDAERETRRFAAPTGPWGGWCRIWVERDGTIRLEAADESRPADREAAEWIQDSGLLDALKTRQDRWDTTTRDRVAGQVIHFEFPEEGRDLEEVLDEVLRVLPLIPQAAGVSQKSSELLVVYAPPVARWIRAGDTENAGSVGELDDEQDREEGGGGLPVGGRLADAMASSAQVPVDDPLGDLRALVKALDESLKPHRERFESHLGKAAGHRFKKAEQMREYAELLDWVLHRLDEKLAGPTGKPATLVFKPNTAGEAGVFRFRERGQRAGAASRIVPPDLRLD